jgi:CRP/FNR family cyclic AMP-dependent transcriptional regulator
LVNRRLGRVKGKHSARDAHERLRRLFMVDLFETLPHEELTVLAELCEPRKYRAGEEVFHPETASDRIYVLEQGRVRLYRTGPRDQEMTLLMLEGGTVFGRLGFGDHPQDAHAQAMEASVVATLRREDLERLVMRRPEVGLRIASLADERLALSDDRAADLAHKEVPGRVASLLLRLVDSEGVVTPRGYEIHTRYTHQQVASMIGANREAVTRAFSTLRGIGALEVHRRIVRVTDLGALERAAVT